MSAPVTRRGAVAKWPEEAKEQVVTVIWDDSWGAQSGKWEMREAEVQLDMPPLATIGFLVGINESWVAIAQSIAEDQIGHVLRIPRGCIVDLTVLNITVERPKDD